MNLLQTIYRKHNYIINGGLKENIMRIKENIKEYEAAVEKDKGLGVFGIYDMIRATLYVKELRDMKEACCLLE